MSHNNYNKEYLLSLKINVLNNNLSYPIGNYSIIKYVIELIVL